MCAFCAAIPMSASIGVVLARKQKERQHEAETSETQPSRTEPSIGKITVAVTGSLVVCSAIYHLVIMPRIGTVV